MAYKISTLEVRQKLGDILNRVSLRHDEFIVERKGKALAAVVPVEKIEQMRKAAKLGLLDILNRQEERSRVAEEDSMALANEAKHRTRVRKPKARKR